MMKAIMISIKPKWVAKILNGEKTIEIRKTCPEIFKHLKPYEGCSINVYIYCTKDKPYLANATELFTGKYACISNDEVSYKEHNLNGKVVAKFTLKRIKTSDMTNCLQGSCLSYDEVSEYTKGKKFYGWVIDNLVIFDKPKELSEFYTTKLDEDLIDILLSSNYNIFVPWYKKLLININSFRSNDILDYYKKGFDKVKID